MVLKLYYDILSQPARAVWIFLKAANIEFEPHPVSLMNGEHLAEDYKQINPFGRVPAIDDGGFVLTESVAIMRYICLKYKPAEHWYPRNDLQKQAKVDEYLQWQHLNIRNFGVGIFQNLKILPRMTGRPIDTKKLASHRKNLLKSIHYLETVFLRDTPFLCGNEISVADILGVSELVHLYGCNEQGLFENNPIIMAWIDRVKAKLGAIYEEAFKNILQFDALQSNL